MGKYFLDEETVRIDFADGNWVDVKQELTQEDQDFILSELAKTTMTDGNAELTYNLGRLALLQRSIVAWSFADDDGNPVPVNRMTINKLRLKYRTKVLEEVNRIVEQASEFVVKN